VLGISAKWLNSDFRYECQGNQELLSSKMSLVSDVSVQVSGVSLLVQRFNVQKFTGQITAEKGETSKH
jgi:hypothetical protein